MTKVVRFDFVSHTLFISTTDRDPRLIFNTYKENMKKNKYIYSLLILLLLASSACRRDIDLLEDQSVTHDQPEVFNLGQRSGFLTDVVRVKFTPEFAERIEQGLSETSSGLRSAEEDITTFVQSMKALKVTRVFPPAGKYEARQRKAGLHLWYDISINDKAEDTPEVALHRAMDIVRKFSGVQVAEQVRVLQTPTTRHTLLDESAGVRNTVANLSGFDDPELPHQWHYHNDGSLLRSKPRADINLFDAWKIETGKPNVIVGITDGGVDYWHEDLRESMHINQKEYDGEEGVDDDENGFVDDIYGYNFVLESGEITAHDHGTHVAGTVAARNNNGVGVAGVAGGNGAPDSGVRLLSCQMFHDNDQGRTLSSGGARPIVYAANNGAVISQNSWGYVDNGLPQTLSQSDKEAIDYFIKYAGCDENGNQRPDSPMKGGVVIFAAGNDGKDIISFPGAYAAVVSVASMAPDFSAAYYTNRGDWVSITAPGGSLFYSKGEVLSTLPENKYGYMQGTSMACPHVSGIAALIVSKYGGQGFTNEDLKKRLTTALLPLDINENNPKYKTRLGAGYIDAARALASPEGNKAPEGVRALSSKATFTGIDLSWDVASDENDGAAYSYNLYYSSVEINESNYKSALKIQVTGARSVGEKVHYLHTGLRPGAKYYYAVEALDRWGAVSKSVAFATVTTLNNTAPVLTLDDMTTIRITGDEQVSRKVIVSEPDGQDWTYTIIGDDYDVKHRRSDKGEIELTFRVSRPSGKYAITVLVTDALGLTSDIDIPFEFYQNRPPRPAQSLDKIIASIGKAKTLDLNKYFVDDNKDELTYTVTSLNPDIVTATVSKGVLSITPMGVGVGGLSLIVSDPSGLALKVGVTVQVVQGGLVQMVYPTLVDDVLNVRVADDVRRVYVTVLTPSGRPVTSEQTFTLDKSPLIRVNVKSLEAGNYVLLVESKDERFTQSFIKR